MTYLSLLEKIKILFSMLLDFKVVLIFSIIILILTVLYMIKILNKKKYTLSMIGSFILVFAISIISNYKILSSTFDNFTTIFFRNIYFPSIYVYISMLVINLITFITSILSKKMRKVYKVLNSIIFVLNNVILVIILNIIAKNKIDIFSISSLYTNTNLVGILELSMNIFILWTLSILGVYITNVICDNLTLTKKEKVNVKVPVLEVNAKDIKEENTIIEKPIEVVETVASNEPIIETTDMAEKVQEVIPEYTYTAMETPNTVVVDVPKEEPKLTFDDILNGNIPLVYYDTNNGNNNDYQIVNPEEIYNSVKPVQNAEVNIIKPNTFIKDNNSQNNKIVENTINDISLDDLIKGENIIEEVNNDFKKDIVKKVIDTDINENKILNNDKYTLEDYKKIVNMLKEIKSNLHSTNISIDEAVTLSLISDYSIDDCVKFKEILESNLN